MVSRSERLITLSHTVHVFSHFKSKWKNIIKVVIDTCQPWIQSWNVLNLTCQPKRLLDREWLWRVFSGICVWYCRCVITEHLTHWNALSLLFKMGSFRISRSNYRAFEKPYSQYLESRKKSRKKKYEINRKKKTTVQVTCSLIQVSSFVRNIFIGLFSHAFSLDWHFNSPQATKCTLQYLFLCFLCAHLPSAMYTVLTELRCNGLPTGFQKHNSEAKQQGFPCRIFELIMFKNKNVNISTTRNS